MYAELHAISNYSFLRSASHPEELVEQAAQLGYQAIALTDECSLAGCVKAHDAALQHQIKLIIGAEFHLAEGLLVVLAENRQGYARLSQLITLGRRRVDKGHYQLSLEDFSTLVHCICLWRPPSFSECANEGRLTEQTIVDVSSNWHALALRLREQLKIDCYLLAERQLVAGDAWHIDALQLLSQRVKMPCVAAGNIRMHCETEQRTLDLLSCIRHGCDIHSAGALLSQNAEAAMQPIEVIRKRFPEDWLKNTVEIAARCHFSLTELRYEYPAELVPSGFSAASYLTQEVRKGAIKRFDGNVPESVQNQYQRELEIIIELRYEYFFLTIYDLVTFAKQQRILHQGRGSAANSVVCYCLGITEVDPTKVNMLFERFISKERHEPPDIDVDFEHERREEVIQYIYQKYGRDRAALAASVISYRFRSAMRDVGKVLGIDQQRIEQLLTAVDRRDSEHDWQQQLSQQQLVATQGAAAWLLPLVQRLMGFPRHLSQHVGGFIISAGPLAELVPIENAAMPDRTVIQWDKDDLESLGLLKVDVLALGMLTAIRKCLALVSQHFRPLTLPQVVWEDPAVYRMLQQGDSMGVFQVESRAQTSMLPRLKPACYYDLVVQIAIVRPGPIQGDMVHPYLRRRDGIEQVDYPSDEVRQVLQRTLGVPIFQEQVIQLAMVAAGFSGGEADQLRRAMASWKRSGELEKFEQKLKSGMAARGYSEQFAQQIFKQIRGFGEYGFPESHSASFALLAYVSAYLKYYFPEAFCCALLNSQPMGFYSPSQLIQDLRRHGGQVLSVCVNHSEWDCTLTVDEHHGVALQLGLRLVKGLSYASAQTLLKARRQPFSTLTEVGGLGIARDELEALASANAFSHLSGDRHQVRWQLAACQQLSLPLLADAEIAEPKVELPAVTELAAMLADYQQTGLTLGRHPLALLREAGALAHCQTADALWQCRHGQVVHVAGLVVGRQRPGTASGVTFVTLEDETGHTNVVVWSATAKAQRRPFLAATILKVSGVVEFSSGVMHVIAGQLTDISHALDSLSVHSRDFK
ncbi:error-prone DNA polymerase [Shewanella avicenniae]|uniref:Error-prone DNA polymerase n=1 Tax=Shewanella avicenniae TaxID=2814294 RepID=A0ABX7QVF8_9GAMM|nr:error-prone DNA polymerase [Shewanella avicenniae]QSX35254.1 error-prone DNA polymerase [Shewanella avicenniae]